MSSVTQEKRGRPVTAEEARNSAKALIDHYFSNQGRRPKICIPVQIDDDDVILCDFISENSPPSPEPPTTGENHHGNK